MRISSATMIFNLLRQVILVVALMCVLDQAMAQGVVWQLDPQIEEAARNLLPPAPMKRRALGNAEPRISPALHELLAQRVGGTEAEPVPIRILGTSRGDAASRGLNAEIINLGGSVEASLAGMTYATLPAPALFKLARSGRVERIEPQAMLVAQSLESSGEGASLSAETLNTLHRRGIRGQGVRVGVLDFGFAGYSAIRDAQPLPTPIAQQSFAPSGDVFSGSTHGTECVRIIHQIAPEAELVLAAVGDSRGANEGQVLAASQWLASKGATIINFSASGYVSPLDGSATLDQLIDQLSGRGITWLVAAGNNAHLHWRGDIADNNHNGWIDLGPANETRRLGDLFALEVTQTGPVSIIANWTPWSGTGSDVDLVLYRATSDGKTALIALADTLQVAGSVRPVEMLSKVLEAGVYLLGLRASRLASPGSVHIFVSGAQRMTPFNPQGSVGSPGTSKSAITVGAATTASMTEEYSGRGPTDDGRIKPELLAAWSEGANGFHGTSAATPLVAGMAALIESRKPTHPVALRARLKRFAKPFSDDGKGVSVAWGAAIPDRLLSQLR